jgi:hypothetical protein
MHATTHKKYFANVDTHTDTALRWTSAMGLRSLAGATRVAYDFTVIATIAAAVTVTHVSQLETPMNATAVLWYNVTFDAALTAQRLSLFRPVAMYFGIWSDSRRGMTTASGGCDCGRRSVADWFA